MKRLLLAAMIAALPAFTVAASADPWIEAQGAFADYDDMRAVSLLRADAASGHMRAPETLGLALVIGPDMFGKCFTRERNEGLSWLSRAATQGSVFALHVLRKWSDKSESDASQATAIAQAGRNWSNNVELGAAGEAADV
jgi:hypothetical protein